VAEYSVFVINGCGSPLSGRIEFTGIARAAAWSTGYGVPRRGVARIDVRPTAMGMALDQAFRFACEFDRRTPHRKPILFRRFVDGSITANHS